MHVRGHELIHNGQQASVESPGMRPQVVLVYVMS